MSIVTDATPLPRRILDLDHDATQVLVGMVASHFATADTLDRETVARYLDEAQAVTR